MDLERYKEYSLMTVTITLAFCAAFLLGGLSRAIFVELSIASVWLFLKTLNRRIFSVFPKHGDLPHDNIPKRLWRVFVEVVLQYRVVREIGRASCRERV